MIDKLLVANRGEIARRIMRTAHEMGIATVAVYADPDAGAPHVAEAGEAVHLPGAAATDTYLRADLIIAAARRTGATAVHPGYGFLSENAAFARDCVAAGLTFVGPPAPAIEAMGSKVESKRLMAEAGVPILAGFTVADGTPDEETAAAADRIGYPVLVKAAFGGGGRGMRSVFAPAGLAEAVAGARQEAAAAFGDGLVFLERLVTAPRHIEVQVFADQHGTVVDLFERECSIQRRHQKVIEEAPSPAVDAGLRAALQEAAVAAARAIGYVGAGTVEFILDTERTGATGERFAFLEMNTRLQVEHPVTEAVTGLDLVRLQLEVADGHPLPAAATDAALRGHAIEARLYAEDVAAGFLPASGPIHRFRIAEGPGLRVDAGYEDGSVVGTAYDAMLAKVVAWAPTREEAAAKLAAALAGAELHGPVTNRDLLVRTLRHPEFIAGATDTGFYERHDPTAGDPIGAPLATAEAHAVHAAAVVVARRHATPTGRPSPVPAGIPAGWRNVGPRSQPAVFALPDGSTVEVGEPAAPLAVTSPEPGIVDVVVDDGGVRRRVRVQRVGTTWYADSGLGSSVLEEVSPFPDPLHATAVGSLLAPLPGSVVELLVAAGDAVAAGQTVLTMEAMKMRHAVRAPLDGTVSEVRVAVGQQVDSGAVLLVVDEA